MDYGTGIRIAAPSTVLSSIAKAARQGILIKGGRHLEILAGIDTIVFDKTGTLTKGEPELEEIISYRKDISSEQILSLAASAEERLTHPVAEVIVSSAKKRGLIINDDPEMWVEFSPEIPKIRGKDYESLKMAATEIMGDRFGGRFIGKIIRYVYVKTKYHYKLRNFLVRLYSKWVSSRLYESLITLSSALSSKARR